MPVRYQYSSHESFSHDSIDSLGYDWERIADPGIAPRFPFKVYLPRTTADVVRAVREAQLLGQTLRVRSKGHSSNGLVLEERWIAGSLISVFQVGERVLESRYTLRGDTLVHDVVWWSAKPATSMKGEGPNAERGAAVLSFSVEGRQQAVMTRALR